MTTLTRMTLDEFLALPETEPPSEFICGEVVQKTMPTLNHGLISSEVLGLLRNFLKLTGQGSVVDNVRYARRPESRAYLPDVSVILRSRMPTDPQVRARGALEMLPDIAIEVLSPDDRASRVAEKLAFYLRSGVPLVWIIDPEERTLAAHRPGLPSTLHAAGDVIGAEPVLAGLELALDDVFSVLDEPA